MALAHVSKARHGAPAFSLVHVWLRVIGTGLAGTALTCVQKRDKVGWILALSGGRKVIHTDQREAHAKQ